MIGPNHFDSRFYVFSVERKAGACWWKPNGCGFTADVAEAGAFTLQEVTTILAQSHGDDIPVPVNLVDIIAALTRCTSTRN